MFSQRATSRGRSAAPEAGAFLAPGETKTGVKRSSGAVDDDDVDALVLLAPPPPTAVRSLSSLALALRVRAAEEAADAPESAFAWCRCAPVVDGPPTAVVEGGRVYGGDLGSGAAAAGAGAGDVGWCSVVSSSE